MTFKPGQMIKAKEECRREWTNDYSELQKINYIDSKYVASSPVTFRPFDPNEVLLVVHVYTIKRYNPDVDYYIVLSNDQLWRMVVTNSWFEVVGEADAV